MDLTVCREIRWIDQVQPLTRLIINFGVNVKCVNRNLIVINDLSFPTNYISQKSPFDQRLWNLWLRDCFRLRRRKAEKQATLSHQSFDKVEIEWPGLEENKVTSEFVNLGHPTRWAEMSNISGLVPCQMF